MTLFVINTTKFFYTIFNKLSFVTFTVPLYGSLTFMCNICTWWSE